MEFDLPTLEGRIDENIRKDSYKPEDTLPRPYTMWGVLTRDEQRFISGREREHTPLSNHLFEALREPLRDYLPDDAEYDAAFDWFEYLICLAHIDQQTTRAQSTKRKSRRPTSICGRLCELLLERRRANVLRAN